MAAGTFGKVLKHTLNRITTRVAMGKSGPLALVRHVGRKSGTSYATPIIVQPTAGGFVIELTYGPNVDWYRNVRAAGGCGIRFHGVEYTITGFEDMDAATGIAAFTPGQQRILRLLRRDHFVKFLGGPAPTP
jgi:deazaflavin-dependent oxidoreductase (nitroreductase family)